MDKKVQDEKQQVEEITLDFPWGLPGLEYTRYKLSVLTRDSPFYFLQSVEESQVGLLLINPFVIKQDYEFDLDKETVALLKISNENTVAVFCTVNTSKGMEAATVNLLAPIIVNAGEGIAKQKVLTDQRYSLREPLKMFLKAEGRER